MGYYVRAFCSSEQIPSIKELLDWSKSQIATVSISGDADSRNWSQIEIYYKKNKSPFLSEIIQEEGDSECLMETEIEEFQEFLSEIADSSGKSKVLKHLKETKYIVVNQIPTSDFDDDGYEALGVYLQYFIKHCGGMVQADSEGFYEGNELIVELD